MSNYEACQKDNELQKKLIRKEITVEQFNDLKKESHSQFEEPELAGILAKYGKKI
jgi:hypothetical protein